MIREHVSPFLQGRRGREYITPAAGGAFRESQIREAQGEAEAIMLVQKATADSIRMINEAKPSREVLAIKGIEAFTAAADGKATKIIIPSDIQSLAGLAVSVKELIN